MSRKRTKKLSVKLGWKDYAVLCSALMLLLVVPLIMLGLLNRNDTGDDSDRTMSKKDDLAQTELLPDDDLSVEETAESQVIIIDHPAQFPLLLENGKLEITSIFRYDGLNPDCDNRQGKDITAIEVRNLSDEHLENAVITMDSDGAGILHFTVSELPSGRTAMVFSSENTASNGDTVFGNASCEAHWNKETSISNEGKISISVEGVHITLTNQTDTEIHEIVVYCRSALDDRYFGGVAYSYTVNNIPAHGTAELDAVDCLLGLAEVVRVEITKP